MTIPAAVVAYVLATDATAPRTVNHCWDRRWYFFASETFVTFTGRPRSLLGPWRSRVYRWEFHRPDADNWCAGCRQEPCECAP